ncbi:hypothetical protein [Streptomyces griseorubiginosus]|uniref:hypothetical protein n=1 Tax=Streptomyces griseorubiginosus TaxID=67304 RepID=UPI002E8063DA|nr:hypothetical protein [Streptomyces griseorubiginosus]WUB50248.1 hypothetical protein OHN19_43660 [Streptomyces griseorubiginosus]
MSRVTRFLCAAAYNHRESFRAGILQRLTLPTERFLPPAYGVDPGAVAWHCVRAQRLDAVRELATLAVLAVALWVEPVSAAFVVYVGTALCLRSYWRQRLRLHVPKPSGVRQLAVPALTVIVALSLVVYAALLVYAAWSGLGGQVPWLAAWSAPAVAAQAAGTWVLVGLPAGWGVVAAAERRVRRRRWQEIRTAKRLGPPETRGLWGVIETSTARGLRRLSQLEQVTHVEYADDAFYGAGDELEQFPPWSFATQLRRQKPPAPPDAGAGRLRLVKPPEDSGPLLSHSEVIDAIREGMQRFRAGEARAGARLQQLTMRDYVFAPQGHPALIGKRPPGDVLADEDEEARHMLGIRVGSWEEDLSTTTFVRATTHGDILYLEVSVRVLLPVQNKYRWSIRTIDAGVLSALCAIPRDILLAVPRHAWQLARRFRLMWGKEPEPAERSAAQAEGWDVPAPPLHINSLREQVAQPSPQNIFQRLDIERYVKAVEHRLISSVQDLLERKGLESDEFTARVSQVFNTGVIINGGVQSGSIAGGHTVAQTNQTTVQPSTPSSPQAGTASPGLPPA